MEVSVVKSSIDTAPSQGLTSEEAALRLKQDGPNELPSSGKRGWIRVLLEILREPMLLLLLICGSLYLILGDKEEALMLLGFVFVVIGITYVQEKKTENALEALRDLSSPRALVRRDGEWVRIAGRDVVRGDIMMLSEGDRVPADALLVSCTNLNVDESLLTGESVPVRKEPWDGVAEPGRPGGEGLPTVYSGTLVVAGQGTAKVHGIGAQTEIGKIGKALQSLDTEKPPLQREISHLVRDMAMVGLGLCIVVTVVYAVTRGNNLIAWQRGFLSGLAMAMGVLPEEFPVVLTIFMAMGAWRMSQNQVLTRHMPAIETLGSATVLCVDKTGTLTLNRMAVRRLAVNGEYLHIPAAGTAGPLPDPFHELVEYAVLACDVDPFDPMERAILDVGKETLAGTEHLHNDWSFQREYPLSRQLLALTHAWQVHSGDDRVAAKGAPEAILDLCHLLPEEQAVIMKQVMDMANDGLRVLGVARATYDGQSLPDSQHDFDFTFIGLVALADPIRPTVRAAIEQCHHAGVRVVMITGDYPGTAQSIAREIGLQNPDRVVTGSELDAMSEDEMKQRVGDVCVFARMVPEQKLGLVQALKAKGEIVAMTGDGVNDAPALKNAHIGIAMGERGTDVARESAALVLLKDDFGSIVTAVRMGRRIFDNIRKAMGYILAVHVPIAGLCLVPVLLGWPLILMPVHIVFLELIIDPTCSIVFESEAEESNIMDRPPRDPAKPTFSGKLVLTSILQGASILVAILVVFGVSYFQHGASPEAEMNARGLAFTTLIFANIALILTNRSWTRSMVSMLRQPNRSVWWVILIAIGLLALTLYTTFGERLFQMTAQHPLDVLIAAAVGFACVLWFEVYKALKPKALA
ncbi:MAG: cation-translocating P-type ATPase [Caldisericota bacterium]|nr:cation-translocating P-type ATPase [Caldisericota bacterium]